MVVAAWNEEAAIVPTLERIAGLAYPGPLEVVLADNNSTDRTAERARGGGASGSGSTTGGSSSPRPGKHHALNTALESVTTPLVMTVDADTLLHPEALTYLIARVAEPPAGPARLRLRRCAGGRERRPATC